MTPSYDVNSPSPTFEASGIFPSRYSMGPASTVSLDTPPGTPKQQEECVNDDENVKDRAHKAAKRWEHTSRALTRPARGLGQTLISFLRAVDRPLTSSSSSMLDHGEVHEKESRKTRRSVHRLKLALVALLSIVAIWRVLGGIAASTDALAAVARSSGSLLASSGKVSRAQITGKIRSPARSSAAAAVAHANQGRVRARRPRHPINSHGRLEVDTTLPIEAHPIYQLIDDAKTKWQAKNERQSKTLKQAVAEYRRRNRNLNPPKGFEKWWRFVQENDVQLPDEYDQINEDLKIFRALSPRELAKRIEKAARQQDTFEITIIDGEISNRTTGALFDGAVDRVAGQVDLLNDFDIDWIPDMKAVYGLHDTPQGFIGWELRRDLIDRYEDGEYYEDEEIDTSVRGWTSACPPDSPARHFNRFVTPANKGKQFIANHAVSFDLCHNPQHLALHGVTAGRQPNVDGELKAMFSLSKTSLHSDVLAVPVEQWVEDLPTIPWSERKDSRLLWRGANTGIYHSKKTHWRDSHRTRVVKKTSPTATGQLEVLPAPLSGRSGATLEDKMITAPARKLNSKMFDVAFAGEPIQCGQQTCQELRDEYDFKPEHMTFENALAYKYVLDVDGNAWSARTKRLFAGEQLVFKSTIMPEWWNQRIAPWVHYVPIQLDYSDLHDALTFFRGDVQGKGGEDKLAEEIARAGLEWSQTHWRRVDMAAYTARLYLEWARLLAPNRSAADFVYDPSMEL